MAVIKLDNVSKRFGENVLFESASISIEAGTTVGIVGANGSGKSVLYKLIVGMEYADSGNIYVREKLVGKDCDFPENLGIFVNRPGYIDYYDGFQNLKMLAEVQNKIDDNTIRAYMKRLGLDPDDKKKVKHYSEGMKQKLGITQAIMEGQDIILLDEPFNALDFQTNKEIIETLKILKEEKKTVLLTSHQHEYLEKICDELYIISDKRLVPLDEEMKKRYFEF